MTEHRVMTPDDLMTPDEFAELARVHRRTVERWARLGVGPEPKRHGPRLVRYVRAEAEDWLSGRAGRGGGDAA